MNPPAASGLIHMKRRLDTLKHWPFTGCNGEECTAEKLAEVGFYCPNPDVEPDSLRCFVCQKELDGWEPSDSPLNEHRKHSSSCKFLKMGCKGSGDMTLKQYLTLQKLLTKKYYDDWMDVIDKQYDHVIERYKAMFHAEMAKIDDEATD